jgi:membrane protein YdbS with pleckstrin-like domain
MVAPNNASFQRFTGWGLIELLAWVTFLVQLPISFMLLRLDFEMRWYLLADRSLRIREGTLVVREKTMSYANIQNISIRRNPLQRIFGLATVAVRAAGGGSRRRRQSAAPADTRTKRCSKESTTPTRSASILRERIRRHRDSGLGDPDDVYDDEVTRHQRSPPRVTAGGSPRPAHSDTVSPRRRRAHCAPASPHGGSARRRLTVKRRHTVRIEQRVTACERSRR